MRLINKILAAALVACAVAPASATTWMIGDNDGYGIGIPDNGDHPFNGFTANYDGRSDAEKLATDGAQYTDTYSTTHDGYGPQPGTVATFRFAGLGNSWTEGSMWFDMADFQAQFGAVAVRYNGILQDWAFEDGFPHTKVRHFDLGQDVLDTINSSGELIVEIDRNGTGDFYGFDYALLSDREASAGIPEPSSVLLFGAAIAGGLVARRRARKQAK